jgi:hypothetical protein
MKDKRRYKRFSVEIFKIIGNMFANEVKILDINLDGVSLKADIRFDIGSEYKMKLHNDDQVVLVKGVIESSRMSETKKNPDGEMVPIYNASMKFTGVSGEERATLLHFIEVFRKEEEHKLSVVSVSIDAPERTVLDLSTNYQIKKLSLGGMLIGSEHSLEIERRMSMEISLPDKRIVRFIGRVASCLSDETSPGKRFDLGIEFLQISDEDRKTLKEFIQVVENMKDGQSSDDTLADIWAKHKYR